MRIIIYSMFSPILYGKNTYDLSVILTFSTHCCLVWLQCHTGDLQRLHLDLTKMFH